MGKLARVVSSKRARESPWVPICNQRGIGMEGGGEKSQYECRADHPALRPSAFRIRPTPGILDERYDSQKPAVSRIDAATTVASGSKRHGSTRLVSGKEQGVVHGEFLGLRLLQHKPIEWRHFDNRAYCFAHE